MALRESFTCVVATRSDRTIASELITHFVYGDKFATAYYPGGDLLLSDSMLALQAEFGDAMVRAHRNALVRTSKIRRMDTLFPGSQDYQIWIDGVEAPLRISRSGKKAIHLALPELQVSRHGRCTTGEAA